MSLNCVFMASECWVGSIVILHLSLVLGVLHSGLQVGYQGPGKGQHVIKLASDYCRKKAVIQHELMHALGFHHEMTRPDRDQYVKIIWDKIKVPPLLLSVYSF